MAHHFPGPSYSMFDGLSNEEEAYRLASARVMTKRLEARKRLQEGRTIRPLQQPDTYRSPYAVVKNSRVKRTLLEIAERFQFLDRGFAEYFQEIVPTFDHDHVRNLLKDARNSIAVKQSQDTSDAEASDTVVLGELGHFCEDVARGWEQKSSKLKFMPHNRDKDILYYLQDVYEVPYWDLMMTLFSKWRANSRSLSGDVVMHVLNSIKLDVREKKARLGKEMRALSEAEKEEIAPIIRGIDARLEILGSMWDNNTSNFEIDNMLTPFANTAVQETVWLVALSLICFMIATIPLMRGFAISAQENSIGTTQDADFYYLIQGNVMTVLGNFLMVIPLLKESWFSPTYIWMWTFMLMSLLMCGVSVGLYLVVQTGWSSMVAFFASVAGTSAVLVVTQATVKIAPEEKVKKE
ncbi:hypothetical protein GRF29_103g1324892 [Pseudopithomyces chartarum]|uniref:Uncharacterized protein n=1 Tax=Pseudopithomyces chartarum TaxID=1892770 RepID=A0AAN6LWS1_9PLEO|nr:hypothetical protein GRF29_103g1324892 [Pseudopithomyces chartarum]